MATNGLITIIKDKEVWAKIVCGCEGHQENIDRTVELIKKRFFIKEKNKRRIKYNVSASELRDYALKGDMGCNDCLVAIVRLGARRRRFSISYRPAEQQDVSPLYKESFDLPYFNPRWECGVVSGFALVNLDTGEIATGHPSNPRDALETTDQK